jgi:hypothetical protein
MNFNTNNTAKQWIAVGTIASIRDDEEDQMFKQEFSSREEAVAHCAAWEGLDKGVKQVTDELSRSPFAYRDNRCYHVYCTY